MPKFITLGTFNYIVNEEEYTFFVAAIEQSQKNKKEFIIIAQYISQHRHDVYMNVTIMKLNKIPITY